jgi:hypothetical protein
MCGRRLENKRRAGALARLSANRPPKLGNDWLKSGHCGGASVSGFSTMRLTPIALFAEACSSHRPRSALPLSSAACSPLRAGVALMPKELNVGFTIQTVIRRNLVKLAHRGFLLGWTELFHRTTMALVDKSRTP